MTRWEYKTIALAAYGFMGGKIDMERFEHMLNQLGRDGWELVSVFGTHKGYGTTRNVIAVLKRERVGK